jgi:hypothetical protein
MVSFKGHHSYSVNTVKIEFDLYYVISCHLSKEEYHIQYKIRKPLILELFKVHNFEMSSLNHIYSLYNLRL